MHHRSHFTFVFTHTDLLHHATDHGHQDGAAGRLVPVHPFANIDRPEHHLARGRFWAQLGAPVTRRARIQRKRRIPRRRRTAWKARAGAGLLPAGVGSGAHRSGLWPIVHGKTHRSARAQYRLDPRGQCRRPKQPATPHAASSRCRR